MLANNLKNYLSKPNLFVYPLAIVIILPVLVVANTLWNLNSFNNDVNYLIRHQAISISDTMKPYIAQAITNKQDLGYVLRSAKAANSEIVSLTLFTRNDNTVTVLEKTEPGDTAKDSQDALNQLALSLNQPFAALIYDQKVGDKIWNVVVPLDIDKKNSYILQLKLKRDAVDAILDRTSRDSFIIMLVTVIAALLLLVNHFTFYQKAILAQKLAEIDKLKDEFIAMGSHELRAPVTGLRGYLELLKDKLSPDAAKGVEKELTRINNLINRLADLINDLLDVSTIQQGRMQIKPIETDVQAAITDICETFNPVAAEKSLEIVTNIQTLPKVQTDPDRLRQVLTNLVSNAVKYSLQGKITVSALQEKNTIKITVQDTGIGIPADKIPYMFDKFYRVKDEKTEKVEGTGLGLWITKQITELLGGTIYVESIYGTGTLFTFTLPIR
jgi:signal transduction histidine kinase